MVSFLEFQRQTAASPRATPCKTDGGRSERSEQSLRSEQSTQSFASSASLQDAPSTPSTPSPADGEVQADKDEAQPEDILFCDEISLAGASIPQDAESISILSVICSKTGRVLGELSLPDDGEVDFTDARRLCMPMRGVATEWLETKPADLDRLMLADPRGYAVYCLGFLARAMRRNCTTGEAKARGCGKFNSMPDDAASLWALARAAKWMECFDAQGDETLTALNETLCRGLSILPTFSRAIRYTVTSQRFRRFREHQFRTTVVLGDLFAPDFLARRAAEGTLQPLLTKALSDAIAGTLVIRAAVKRGRAYGDDRATSPADAARGPSQIKAQRVSKRTIEYAQDFARLFSEYGISETLFQPGGGDKARADLKFSLARKAEQKREQSINAFGNAFKAAAPAPQNGAELADGPEIMSDEELLLSAVDDLSLEDIDLPDSADDAADDDDFGGSGTKQSNPKAAAFSFEGLFDHLAPPRETDDNAVETRHGAFRPFRKL